MCDIVVENLESILAQIVHQTIQSDQTYSPLKKCPLLSCARFISVLFVKLVTPVKHTEILVQEDESYLEGFFGSIMRQNFLSS